MNRNEIRDVYFYRLCYQNDAHIITDWCKIKMYISRKWNLMFRKMAPQWPTNNDIYHHVTSYLFRR